jgi:serine/threonine-protein kinase
MRHQAAGEILRARSILVVACSLWVIVGVALDLATFPYLGSGSLAFVLVVRFATTAYHTAVIVPLFRLQLPPKLAMALVQSVFPLSAFSLMLMATHMGGLASPYVTAVFVVQMGQAIACPNSWQKMVPLAAVSALVWPIGLLIGAAVDDTLHAQLADMHTVVVFATDASVLIAGAIVCVWGGHIMWSLRRSVFESRKLGRYRLLRRIGRGGMGEVWRAEDRALRRNVALKILSPESGRKPSRVARFEREIQITAQLTHPNVVRIHDWGVTDDGVWYYAMDLLEGVDLQTLVKQTGPLPPALALVLCIPAARGLDEAHRHGIVHRDVKPGNMFVVAAEREPKRIELLDFGIATIGDDVELTQAGAVIGTPGFMAPEAIAGAPASVASDVYSFAASLYYALTATTPREAKHAPASAIIAAIPARLDDALVRALDADPSRRFESMNEFADALAALELEWTGSFVIDQDHTSPSATDADPSIDTAEPPTQVDAPNR